MSHISLGRRAGRQKANVWAELTSGPSLKAEGALEHITFEVVPF